MAAKIEKAKGINFSYNKFLWDAIGSIINDENKHDYSSALAKATSLIVYLPDDIKDKYRAKAEEILQTLTQIEACKIPALQKITDVYLRSLMRNKISQLFASKALRYFIDSLSTTLNAKGYMERIEDTPEGWGSTLRPH